MHDPEDFQRQTIKAITDLQREFGQTPSRQLALEAVVRALVSRLPLAELGGVIEEFDAEVDHQVAKLPPTLQRPQFRQQWSDVLEARRKTLQQHPGSPDQ